MARRRRRRKLQEMEGDVSSIGIDIPNIVNRFQKHFDEVESHFVERKGELEQIKYAMLTKEHVLLKGKTGTAKSKLGKFSFGYITGAETFSIQLSKFMSEEYLFGAIDINKMRNEGKVEHVTDDSIVDCEFAFIDEVFDGNDSLLRSLLEVLNERSFTRHTQKIKAKLHSAIMTSNYVREDEVTEAFLDRILFKSEVKAVTSNKNRMTMYQDYVKMGDCGFDNLGKKLHKRAVSLEELQSLSEFILGSDVELPDSVLRLYDMILREYSKQLNCYISDRKANKMLNILKASAVLKGRTRVACEDVEAIKFALVTLNNEQQEEVFRAVFTKLMEENAQYEAKSQEMESFDTSFVTLRESFGTKLNPKSKEILDLNEEIQLFEQKIRSHNFIHGSGFKDIDSRFNSMRQETEKMIREIAKALNLNQ